MIVRDWRTAGPGLLRRCYDSERTSWREDLAWDTTRTWATIEQARVTWGLPGLLAVEDDRIDGWAFYLREGSTMQVGGVVASTVAATAALLDGIVAAADPGVTRISCFIRERAPGLGEALSGRAFDVERFAYLSRPLTTADAATDGDPQPVGRWTDAEPWHAADAAGAADLLRAAYPREAGQHFAPNGTPDEWHKYVTGLVRHDGCGTFDPAATRVLRDTAAMVGLAVVTAVAPETAHLAQLAVHPAGRGHGLASCLVRDAIRHAAQSGKSAMTLLVGERNSVARHLYASIGFTERGTFIAAHSQIAKSRSKYEGELSTLNLCHAPLSRASNSA